MAKIAVYIASPYTIGDKLQNVYKQIDTADQLRSLGFLPVVPLMTHFWHERIPHEYEYWMKMDFEVIDRCDCLLRLYGESSGADREVLHALKKTKIPVFFTIDSLKEHYIPPF